MNFKSTKFYFIALFSLVVFFAGCNDDEKVLDPTISLSGGNGYTSSDATVKPGDSVLVKIIANKGVDGKDLDKLEVLVAYDGGAPVVYKTISDIKSASLTEEMTFAARTKEGTEGWIFKITDKDGLNAETRITLTVKSDVVNPTAPKKFNVTFTGGGKEHCSSQDGNTYTKAEGAANASKIDLSFFYSGTSKSNMISPKERSDAAVYTTNTISWGSVITEFRKTNLSTSDFDALNDESKLQGFFDGGTATQVPTRPDGVRFTEANGDFVVGKVIAFKSNGKYGLIKIVSVASSATGSAVVELKVHN